MKKDASAEPAEEKVRPRFRLKLDHDDVYFGCELLGKDEPTAETEIVLDHEPDNPPGRYRWSREHNRLEPLPKEKQKDAPEAPTLEQAFYDLVDVLIGGGALNAPLPPRLSAWRKWFEKTFDSGG